MRVRVWTTDREKYLGEGTIVSHVTIYGISAFGHMFTDVNPEIYPDVKPEYEHMVLRMPMMPKILLDTGEFKYGCQLSWQPCKDNECRDKGPIRSWN